MALRLRIEGGATFTSGVPDRPVAKELIREIEAQKCDKFLRQAEVYLKKSDGGAATAANAAPRAAAPSWLDWLTCCTATATA